MNYQEMTKKQLIAALLEMHGQVKRFEKLEKECQKAYVRLRESETRHKSLLDSSPEPIVVYDKDGITLYVNKAFVNTFGWLPEELIGQSIPYVPAECISHTEATLKSLFSGDPVPSFDTKRVTKDGKILDVHISSALFRDENGNPAGHIVTLRDVSDRKKSREALRLLAAVVEQAAESIFITDADWNIVYLNPAFERISGYSREEVIGQKPNLGESRLYDTEFGQELWRRIANGLVWTGRLVNRKKDGSLYEEDGTVFPMRDTSGKITNYVAVKRDITQEVALERQLRHAQKMEAVGTLAAGIAHDFNNILQAVLGYSEIILSQADIPDNCRRDIERITQAGKHGAELVRRLLSFSRKVDMDMRPINLNDAVEQIKKILTRTIPKMIQVELHLAERLASANADPAQIEQVLLNLAVNAKDAMPDGGTLMFETQNIYLDESYSRTHLGARPGDYVQLTVSDTGHGMDKSTIDHIFEPFFTTKEMGKGTGLGLAIAYGIVKQHGGYIWCYSEPGEGTAFRIYLPAIESTLSREASIVETKPPTGSEAILVIDDDDHVRDLTKRMLTPAGYMVITAANGREGLENYRKREKQIALVILDLIMPGLGGKQCLAELLKIDPKAKIIIASGYSENAMKEAVDWGAKAVLTKPYCAKELHEMVRRILDS
ncbi:MAG: PAS domain S-box protein [Desulfomonile tiedjei]|nr:PAS domain S-box protein [Desulfomonile tiedjei]